jgi:hypothetical protein
MKATVTPSSHNKAKANSTFLTSDERLHEAQGREKMMWLLQGTVEHCEGELTELRR